jgi:hypothetical protein
MTERLQLKFEFNPVEDRLLLRLAEKEGNSGRVEYRFWFTRRFVALFIKAIDRIIENELAADMQVSPDALDAMKKFQKEAALSKADFSASFGEGVNSCKVFEQRPFLVTTLKIKKNTGKKYVLSLLDDNKIGIHLTAGIDMMLTVQKMVADSARRAEWHMGLAEIAVETPGVAGSQGYVS